MTTFKFRPERNTCDVGLKRAKTGISPKLSNKSQRKPVLSTAGRVNTTKEKKYLRLVVSERYIIWAQTIKRKFGQQRAIKCPTPPMKRPERQG